MRPGYVAARQGERIRGNFGERKEEKPEKETEKTSFPHEPSSLTSPVPSPTQIKPQSASPSHVNLFAYLLAALTTHSPQRSGRILVQDHGEVGVELKDRGWVIGGDRPL